MSRNKWLLGCSVLLAGVAACTGESVTLDPSLSSGDVLESSSPVTPGNLLFPNIGLNAIQELNPATRQVVQTVPLPPGYTYSGAAMLNSILVRNGGQGILANVREVATGAPVVILLSNTGALKQVAQAPAGASFIQQMVFDPLDSSRSTILAGIPFASAIGFVGGGGAGIRVFESGLNAIGLVVDRQARLIAGDYATGTLRVYSAGGQFLRVLTDILALTGSNEINGMTRDSQGTLFLAQNSSQRLVKVTPTGAFVGYITHASFNRPASVYYDLRDQRLYVGNLGDGGLTILGAGGSTVDVVDMGGSGIGTGVRIP